MSAPRTCIEAWCESARGAGLAVCERHFVEGVPGVGAATIANRIGLAFYWIPRHADPLRGWRAVLEACL